MLRSIVWMQPNSITTLFLSRNTPVNPQVAHHSPLTRLLFHFGKCFLYHHLQWSISQLFNQAVGNHIFPLFDESSSHSESTTDGGMPNKFLKERKYILSHDWVRNIRNCIPSQGVVLPPVLKD